MKTTIKKSIIKTLALSTALTFVISNSSANQFYRGYKGAPKSPALGLTAGLNVSNINGKYDDLTENQSVLGYNFGASCRIKLSKTFFVEPQLMYSVKGAHIKTAYSETLNSIEYKYTVTISEDFKQKLNYIDMPILFKYQSKAGFNVFGGPSASLLLSARAVGTAKSSSQLTVVFPGMEDVTETTETVVSINESNKSELSGFDIGIVAGAGFQMKNGIGAFLKYNQGLTSISEGSDKYRNSVLSLNMTYVFR